MGVSFAQNAQEDEVKYNFLSDFFSRYDQLAFTFRLEKGIDSITFPLDTTKIKVKIEKYDKKGKKEGEINFDNVVTIYQYKFTPIYSGKYKLPDAKIWSKNFQYPIAFNDTIRLQKPKPRIKLSKADSIRNVQEKKEASIARQKYYENERKITSIESRLNKDTEKLQFIGWSDKRRYVVNDTIRLVFELSKNFLSDYIDVKKISFEPYEIWRTVYTNEVNKGVEWGGILILLKADKKGVLKIPSVQINIEGQELKSKQIKVKIAN